MIYNINTYTYIKIHEHSAEEGSNNYFPSKKQKIRICLN